MPAMNEASPRQISLVLLCKASTCEFPVMVSFTSSGIAPPYSVLLSPPTNIGHALTVA